MHARDGFDYAVPLAFQEAPLGPKRSLKPIGHQPRLGSGCLAVLLRRRSSLNHLGSAGDNAERDGRPP